MGAVAKSYMRKGFLIYEALRKYLVIQYMKLSSVTYDLLDFHIQYMRKFCFSFYQCSSDCCVHREGETAELSCDTLGSPVPTVRWTRRDRDLSGLAHRAIIGALSAGSGALSAGSTGGGGRLLLMNVTASYAGSYTCTASNGLKYPLASLDILLVVLCKSNAFLHVVDPDPDPHRSAFIFSRLDPDPGAQKRPPKVIKFQVLTCWFNFLVIKTLDPETETH